MSATVSAQSPALVSGSLQSGGNQPGGNRTSSLHRFADPRSVTFAAIHQAASENALDLRQTRRVLQTDTLPHRWVSVVEDLKINPYTAGSTPQFELEFVGISGANLSATEIAQRSAVYAKHAGYLFQHGAFHVTDPKAAAQNYTLHYLGSGYRIGRPVHTFAIIPKTLDRSIWLVEFDVGTGYPLACAEFDSAAQRVGGVEVTRFSAVTTRVTTPKWWTAKNLVGEFQSATQAMSSMAAARFVIPAQSELPSGYSYQKSRVTKSSIGPEKSFVMLFSDGVDDFFIAETLNGFAPSLPTVPLGSSMTPYAIMSYQNENVAQFNFYRKGINFLVLGHGSQKQLGELSADLLVRALKN